MQTLQQIADGLVNLLQEKELAYGSSYDKTSKFLELLYPNGVPTNHYDHMLTMVRIFDKLMRIANSKDAFGEDPYEDMAGYSLLGLRREVNKKENKE